MKLYTISGLGADQSVYQYLKLNAELVPLDWIEPEKGENKCHYAKRLAQPININEPFGIVGVSFGGLMAMEIGKIIQGELTLLISSATSKNELRSIYRIVGKLGIIPLLPEKLFLPPKFLAHWLFGTQNKALLNAILEDTDLTFAKWAVIQLTTWKNTTQLQNKTIQIHGTKDKLIPTPPSKKENIILVENGAHFMIVDKAKEVSQIINEILEDHLKQK